MATTSYVKIKLLSSPAAQETSFFSSNAKIKLIFSKLIGKALQRLEELLKLIYK